jgi:beta-galactosidase/beta-glucuronidase
MTQTDQGLELREDAITGEREHVRRLAPFLDARTRSVVRPGAFELLDGEWRFERDPEDCGLAEGWYLGHVFAGTANWPGSVAMQIETERGDGDHVPDVPDAPDAPDADTVAWYEREFEIPDEWQRSAHPVQLTFGACGYETRVWLNGVALVTTEGEAVHLGEYTSFSYELPEEHVSAGGLNRLTVRIADSLDPERPRGKQESHVYKRGGIWYQAISGPVRSVWLEPVERNRLRSRLSVVSHVRDGLVEFGVTTRVRDAGRYRLHLIVAGLDKDEPCATLDETLDLEAGERRQHVVVRITDAVPWSPANPVLYRVVAQLTGDDGHVSQIETRFGLREFEARGSRFYLNGEPIYLDGILYQPGLATFDEIRRHFRAIRELGANLVRVHITGVDPRIYALADEMGLLLWLEVPSPHSSSERSRAAHAAELTRMLVHFAAQPSVVMVSLYNESWGAQDVATHEATRAYIAATRAHLRQQYPQFLVIDNDGWEHVSTEGRLESDVLTAHVYETEVDRWREVLGRLVGGDLDDVTARPLVVGDPFVYAGQLPLVISEWGGFGFSLYGGPNEPDARADRIREFKQVLRELPIAGDVYTQATNVEDETNGLIDAATGELLVPDGLLRSAAIPGRATTAAAATAAVAVDDSNSAEVKSSGMPRRRISR